MLTFQISAAGELGSRYNKIYSSSSSSSSESEEEAVEEVQDNKMETLQITPGYLDTIVFSLTLYSGIIFI